MSHMPVSHRRPRFDQILRFMLPPVVIVLTVSMIAPKASPAPLPQDDQPQTQPEKKTEPIPTIQEGQQLIQNQDFEEATKVFQQIVMSDPTDAQAWFFLGYSLHSQQKLDLALVAHLAAAELGQSNTRPTAMYNIACVYSLKGNVDKAFQWLQRAHDSGFNNPGQLRQDSDLDNIREDPRFEDYISGGVSAPGTNIPGPTVMRSDDEKSESLSDDSHLDWASRPVRRQFDFWVGEWDAINGEGKKVGTNIITRRENGNILHESWTSADGSTGQSINYFDPADKKWKQVWVSEKGGVVYYAGNFTDGAMRYEGDNIKADGTKIHTVCTLTPLEDGRIHHLIRHTTDEGKTWTTYFDAHYVPRSDDRDYGSDD